jgi:hypothetical protein
MNKDLNAAHGLVLVTKFFWTQVPTEINPIVYALAMLEEFHQVNTAQHVLQ